MTDVLEVAVTERAVYARVNRPEVRNAWDREVGAALAGVLDLAADHPVPLVLGSTTPGMFVSGADLAEIAERRLADGLAGRLQYEDADTAAWIHGLLDRRRR